MIGALAVAIGACDSATRSAASDANLPDGTAPPGPSQDAGSASPSNDASGLDASASDSATAHADASAGDAGRTISTDPSTFFGAPRCSGSGLRVCEDFESTQNGMLPAGWAKRSGTWGGNVMGVASDDAARGTHSFKVQGGTNGAQWLVYTGQLGELAMHHFGREFYRVQTPAPVPSSGVLHGDFVEARGPNPVTAGVTNQVRWGMVENTAGMHQWIYNVQRSQGGEFAAGTGYTYQWPGHWTCLEWRFDQTVQQADIWLDGVQIQQLHIDRMVGTNQAEIPIFDDVSVGFANYQNATPEFVVWVDEVAIDLERIGCNN